MYGKSYCTTPGVGDGGGLSGGTASALENCYSFDVKAFYVIGKTLRGELSCTRTGLVLFFFFFFFLKEDIQNV